MSLPWPTIMPDRIGIIGNTQGVNASNKPAPKNITSVNRILSPRNALAIESCSEMGSVVLSAIAAACAVEMGDNLTKLFLVFARLINPIVLPDIKNNTNLLEKDFSRDERRQVNLDPGYISEAKLVLATTKNYAHRIYLDKGIFGDIHLAYTNQSFQKQPWTYPDYQQKEIIDFFNDVRQKYLHQIGEQNF